MPATRTDRRYVLTTLGSAALDVNRDFIPATPLARVPNLFVMHPDLPVRNFAEFIAYAEKNPG